MRRADLVGHEDSLRAHAAEPIVWNCEKKHPHTTRTCPYTMRQATWGDVNFLFTEIDRLRKILVDEELEDV